ncbi:MAG: helix-turn-helix domain-containing protein [Chloroflexota bacterium]
MRYSENICTRYQYAADMISRRWTALILKVLMDKPLRFNELGDLLAVVSDRVLSERLKELEQEQIVERRVYTEIPVRVEYSLTEKGRDLSPVINAIEKWSHDWIELDPDVLTVVEHNLEPAGIPCDSEDADEACP